MEFFLRTFVLLQHRCIEYQEAKVQSVKEQMDAADEADASDGEPDSSPAKLAGNLTVLPATVHFCPQLVPMLAAVHSNPEDTCTGTSRHAFFPTVYTDGRIPRIDPV